MNYCQVAFLNHWKLTSVGLNTKKAVNILCLEQALVQLLNTIYRNLAASHYLIPMFLKSWNKMANGKIVTISDEIRAWGTNQNRLVLTLKGTKELFDGVVLTMPTHQILQLGGSIQHILGNGLLMLELLHDDWYLHSDTNSQVKEDLTNVQYSSRYALGLFYESGTTLNLPYSATYLDNDPVFRFLAVDNVKRNRRKISWNSF